MQSTARRYGAKPVSTYPSNRSLEVPAPVEEQELSDLMRDAVCRVGVARTEHGKATGQLIQDAGKERPLGFVALGHYIKNVVKEGVPMQVAMLLPLALEAYILRLYAQTNSCLKAAFRRETNLQNDADEDQIDAVLSGSLVEIEAAIETTSREIIAKREFLGLLARRKAELKLAQRGRLAS